MSLQIPTVEQIQEDWRKNGVTYGTGIAIAIGLLLGGYFLLRPSAATPTLPTLTSFSNLSITPTSGTAPLLVNASGTALDQNGIPLPSTQITVYVNGAAVGTVTTDASGNFSGSHTFQTTANYTIAFGSASMIISPSTAISVGVPPPVIAAISIVPSGAISIVDPTGQVQVQQVFIGQATDATGAGVPGQNIYAFVNGTLDSTLTQTTDGTGNYSITLNIDPTTFPDIVSFYVSSDTAGT